MMHRERKIQFPAKKKERQENSPSSNQTSHLPLSHNTIPHNQRSNKHVTTDKCVEPPSLVKFKVRAAGARADQSARPDELFRATFARKHGQTPINFPRMPLPSLYT